MEMKFAQCVNKGMQRDYSMSTASQEFAYENKNIRITTTGDESFLAVTNEKSTVYNPVLMTHLQTYEVIFDYKYNKDNIHIEELTITFNFYDGTAEKEEPLKKDTTFRIYDNYEGSKMYEEIVIPKGVTTFTITGYDIQNLHFDKGVEVIQIDNKDIYNMANDVPVNMGTVLGVSTIGKYVIVFSKYEGSSEDVIYRLKESDSEVWVAETVFRGDLNFDINHPIECTTSYESDDVQKVYWVDGLNQPRVVNICKLGQTEHTTNLDFSPKIEGSIKVDIEKEQNGAGLFPAGVIQYYITYYNKFGQESQPAYVSPLYYISPNDKGGKADTTQTCSFKITISNTDPKYDHLRVYSAIRSSKNSEFVVSIVKDISIEGVDKNHQIIDTNTNVINVPSSDILFLGGSVVFPSTIEQKDNTLFLGNIKTGINVINEELEELKAIFGTYRDDIGIFTDDSVLKFKYKIIPVNNDGKEVLYSYNPSLQSNLYDTHYKLREKYRIGIQFIHETGEQSQTVYIGDIINKEHYPHYMSQDVMNTFEFSENIQKLDDYYIDDDDNIHLYDVTNKELNYKDFLCLPIITFDCEKNKDITDCLNAIQKKGFKKYRLMVAETDYKDKSILCQGYINPLTFRLGRRQNNECYGQESWSIRPIGTYKHLENINKCKDGEYTEFSEIRSSTADWEYTNAAALQIDLETNSSIKSVSLRGYSNFYDWGIQADVRHLYYIITVSGTNASGDYTEVSKSLSSGYRTSLLKCYAWDIADAFPAFDTWDENFVDQIRRDFDISETDLASINIKRGDRIFGSTPGKPWNLKRGQVDVLYYNVELSVGVSFSSTDLSKTDVYKENYYLDAAQASFNTPDLENIQEILASNPDINCRIVGKIDIDKVITDFNITLDNHINGDSISSVYKFNFSKVLNEDETAIGIKNFPIVHSVGDNKAYSLMLFDKDGQIPSGDSIDPPTILKNKLIGNLWYASKTDYEFHWRHYIHYDSRDEKGNQYQSTKYYPKNQDYKKATSIEDITDNYTDSETDWTWYTGLIECDLNLYNDKVCLWDSEKYFNEHLYLKDINDLTYNKNWNWIKTKDGDGVTSYTAFNKVKELMVNVRSDKQNQVRMKYNPSKNVLLELNPDGYNIYHIPGYYNYDIQGNVRYLWNASSLCSSDVEISCIEARKFGGTKVDIKFPDYDTDIYDYSKIFYINKECVRYSYFDSYDGLATGEKYLFEGISNGDKHINSLYVGSIVQCLDFDESDGYNPDYYYKFEVVEVAGASYSTYLGIDWEGDRIYAPLYKYTRIYNYNNITYELPRYTAVTRWYTNEPHQYYTIPNISSLDSTLCGKKSLEGYDISNLFCKLDSKWSDRYLPFNLKGGVFDYPYPKSWQTSREFIDGSINTEGGEVEGNGLNNSLWICELYKDFDSFDFLGGCSENAVELNTFIPASQTHSIGNTLYGVYGDTYFKRWDHLRVYPATDDDQTNGVVDTVSLMIETYINLDGDTREARKRLDIRNMRPSNMEGLVNDVYSQKNNIITSHVLDDKFNVTSHPLQYWWSLTKTPNSDIDTWTGVTLTSVAELDGDKGPLNKIKRWNNQLFAFQDKAIAMINFNNQTTIATQEGVPVEIQNSGKVNGHYYITTNNGCKNKWSIVESPVGLYFIDSYNKSINVIGDGIKSLSQLNLFQDWIEQEEQGNIWSPRRFENAFKGFYDPIHKEVYFANGEDCICYNELLEQFTSFYDYEKMNYMFLMDNHIYSIPSSNKLYLMFEGDNYCNLYDEQRDYYIQYKVNNEPFIDKTWTNLEYRADIFDVGNIQTNEFATNGIITNETFDNLKVWNEYQNGELDLTKVRFGYLKDAKPKFRIWRTNLPRAKATDTNRFGLDRIRNPWIMLELRKSGDTSKRMEFHDLIIKYVI